MRTAIVIGAAVLSGAMSLSAQVATTSSTSTRMSTVHATGSFDVQIKPRDLADSNAGTVGRMTVDKQFHGELEATSKGEMLSGGNPATGSAAYTVIEQVDGTLHGKRGGFMLVHRGIMNKGNPELMITIIPDSGTGDLKGISGTLNIRIDGKAHYYDLEYSLGDG